MDNANAKQTVGITINQRSADDEILTFKSSDVGHGNSDNTESDTFGMFKKSDAAGGGLRISGHQDSHGTNARALYLTGYLAEAAQTAHTTSGVAVTHVYSQLTDMSNNAVAFTADGNVFSVGTYDNGSNPYTKFIIDEDGDYFYDGADGGAFDSWDDLELLQTFNSTLNGAVQSGREWFKYNEDALVEAGLIGYCSPEEKAQGHRGLVNGSNMQRLFVGAFNQVYTKLKETTERLELAESKLKLLEA